MSEIGLGGFDRPLQKRQVLFVARAEAPIKSDILDRLNPDQKGMLTWIINQDQGNLQSLVNDLGDSPNKKHKKHRQSVTRALRALGVTIATDGTLNTDKMTLDLKTKKSEVFPTSFLIDVNRNISGLKMKREMVDGVEKQFLIADVKLQDTWRINTSSKDSDHLKQQARDLENLFSLYYQYRTGFAQDMPLKFVFQLSPNAVAELREDRQGVFRKLMDGNTLSEKEAKKLIELDRINISTVKGVFDFNRRLEEAGTVFWRQHGWTGRAKFMLSQTFYHAVVHSGENTVGLTATGLGNADTFAKDIPGLRKLRKGSIRREEDLYIQPKDNARQIVSTADLTGLWGKKIIFDLHSHSAAAGVYVAYEYIKRAQQIHASSSEKIPRVLFLLQNPAAYGTNAFLRGWRGNFIRNVGLPAHQLGLSRIPKVMEAISDVVVARHLLHADDERNLAQSHAQQFANPQDRRATIASTRGLHHQSDWNQDVIDTINENSDLVPLFVFADVDDRLTPGLLQWNQFAGRLSSFFIAFRGHGHYTHLSQEHNTVMNSILELDHRLDQFQTAKLLSYMREHLFFPIGQKTTNASGESQHNGLPFNWRTTDEPSTSTQTMITQHQIDELHLYLQDQLRISPYMSDGIKTYNWLDKMLQTLGNRAAFTH